jgi:hypothetical protein
MISIGKLVKKSDGHESIAEIISTICKYGREVRHVVNHILSPNEQVGIILDLDARHMRRIF